MLFVSILLFLCERSSWPSSRPSQNEVEYRSSRSHEDSTSNAEFTVTRATAPTPATAPPAPPQNPGFVPSPQVVVIEKREVRQGMTLGDALVLNSQDQESTSLSFASFCTHVFTHTHTHAQRHSFQIERLVRAQSVVSLLVKFVNKKTLSLPNR